MGLVDGRIDTTVFRAAIGIITLSLIGCVIGLGMATSVSVAALALAVAILVSTLTPIAGVVSVLIAIPTMYDLHALPWGSFSLLELAILAAFCGVGLHVGLRVILGDWTAIRPLVEPAQVVVPIILLVIATGISLLTLADSGHRDASLREVRTVIIEPLMFFGVARIVLIDFIKRSIAGVALILIGSGIALYGIAQTVFSFGGVAAGSVMRATGPYPHPNNLSFFLERTLLLTLAILVLRPGWWPVWSIAAIQVAGIGATYSRGAFLAIICGFGILLLIRGMYRWLFALGLLGLVGLAGAFAIAPDRLVDAGGSGSEPTRFTIWRAAWNMALDHPVFGVGPDQFLYQYWRRYVEPMGWPERFTSHPHNLVLDVWLRLGVAGLAAFGSLLVGLGWWVKQRFIVIRDDVWAMGAIAALTGGLAHGMMDNGYFLPDLATMTWFCIVMLTSADSLRDTMEGK